MRIVRITNTKLAELLVANNFEVMSSSVNAMQEAEKAYEETINAMLMPSDQAERERFIFSIGYLAGKEAMLMRLSNKTSPFSTK